MSSLICMAVYDTEENGRSEYTKKTIKSLSETVDWNKHKLVIINNNSCEETNEYLKRLLIISDMTGNFGVKIPGVAIVSLSENVGTARAINMGLRMRQPEQFCIKIDNDVVINHRGWVEEMEEVIARNPTIGIVGLKRKDINFDANNENPNYRSKLIQLSHMPGQSWITVEGGGQIMGTCTMFNWRLIDKIGGMKQVGVYGMDDTLYDLRSQMAGFWNCYLPHINIDHIDTGENPYTQEKHRQAGEAWHEYTQLHEAYTTGVRSLYEEI